MDKEVLLYNYFSNSLTDEEQQLFDKLLENDVDFKKQFVFERDLKRAIKEKEKGNLKAKLQELESEIKQKTAPQNNFKIWVIAASFALLLSLGWFGYDNYFKVNYDNLYSNNFQPYPNTAYTITRSNSDDSLERQAFVAYETGNYQIAINNFEKINEPQKEYFAFYKAQSYLNLNNTKKAKTLFKKVITDNSQFVAESHWYLALIAIKEKDKDNAINYLEKLIENYDFNKEKAKALLDNLS